MRSATPAIASRTSAPARSSTAATTSSAASRNSERIAATRTAGPAVMQHTDKVARAGETPAASAGCRCVSVAEIIAARPARTLTLRSALVEPRLRAVETFGVEGLDSVGSACDQRLRVVLRLEVREQ